MTRQRSLRIRWRADPVLVGLSALCVGVVGVTVAIPAIRTVALASRPFASRAPWNGETMAAMMRSDRFIQSLLFSLSQVIVSATLVTLGAAAGGLGLATLTARYRWAVHAVVVSPFFMPSTVIGTLVASMIAPHAGVTSLFIRMVFANAWFNLGMGAMLVATHLRSMPREVDEVAEIAAPAQRARIRLRFCLPALKSVWLLVWVLSFTNFGVARTLGAPANRSLEIDLWSSWSQQLDLARSLSNALIQSCVIAVFVFGMTRNGRSWPTARPHALARLGRSVMGWVMILFALGGAPLVLTLARLVREVWVDGDGWQPVANHLSTTIDMRSALTNSMGGAVMAALAATGVGLAVALVHRLAKPSGTQMARFILVVGWISPLVLGLGLSVGWAGTALDLRGRWISVPVAQFVALVSFCVVRMIASMERVDRSLLEVASTAGLGSLKTIGRVIVPILRPELVRTAALAGVIAVGEYSVSSFVVQGSIPTMAAAVVRLGARPGSLQEAARDVVIAGLAALSLIVVALSFGQTRTASEPRQEIT